LKIDGLDCSKVFKVSPLLMRPAATPGSNRIWGDPHVTEITMPEADFRRANMAKWELSEFDASKVPIRPRSGKLSLFEQGGSPLIAASFRMFQIRRIRPLGGGKVMFEAVLDRFELSKS
jgi:hypothetical protein